MVAMERTITATEANREFSRVFNEVANGETYVVTARGKPVIRMVPVSAEETDREARKQRLKTYLEEISKRPVSNLGRVTRDDGYE
jgi:prevent-host-death family protein